MFTAAKKEVPRDRWGRPLIKPLNGGKALPYTRISTMAKALDDKTALTQWKCKQTALGLSKRGDLITKVRASGGDARVMAEVVNEAMIAAESDASANVGTALHSFTERIDEGVDPLDIIDAGDELYGDLLAYREATRHVTMKAAELFVIVDELQAAGSFDRLVELPGHGLMVADLKTGQHEPKYPHGVTQQIAMYAHGTLYDPDQGRIATLADLGVRTDVGLLIHLPAKKSTCDLYLLDLNHGWQLARTAFAVRASYKAKPITKIEAPQLNPTERTQHV